MKCDYDDTELPEDYVPEVDADGRPCQAVCEACHDIQIRQRAQRLGISEVECMADDLIDQFQAVLEREIRPRLRVGH